MNKVIFIDQPSIVSNSQSKTFYKIAGVLAVLIIAAGLTDAITSMGRAAQANRVIPIVEWFNLFHTSPFEAFSRLGVINIITLTFSIPIYLAFNQAFRKDRLELVAFASILFFIGAAVYLSSNTVFALFAVSQSMPLHPLRKNPCCRQPSRPFYRRVRILHPAHLLGCSSPKSPVFS